MTFNQLRKYLENECPITIDLVEEDLYIVTNIVSFQEAYLHIESKYTDGAIIHLFYEIGVPAPHHLREETNKYRALRRGLSVKFQVPVMPDIEEQN